MEKKEKKNLSKAKKIYNVASTVVIVLIFVFLVVVNGVVLWQRKSGGAQIFGYYMFDVISDSMHPTIEVHDVIISKRVKDVNALQKGDIITFSAPSGQFAGHNITHRIYDVAYNDDGSVKYFKTKGDNPNVGVDNWNLSPSEVKAVYVKTSKFLTGLREFISHWYGYFVLIVVPIAIAVALVIGGYVHDRLAEAKKEREEGKAIDVDDLTDEQKIKLLKEYLGDNGEGAANDGEGATSEEGDNALDGENGDNALDGEDNDPSGESGGVEEGETPKNEGETEEKAPEENIASEEETSAENKAEEDETHAKNAAKEEESGDEKDNKTEE